MQNEHAGELVPLVFDVSNPSAKQRLREMSVQEILFLDQQNSNMESGNTPSGFALNQTADGLEIYVWPRCTQEILIEADMIIPQSRIATDEDGLDSGIKVPSMPVVYGATWWAMEDRGEEFGTKVDTAKQRYDNMVSDAVSAENAAQGFDELVPT